MSIKCERAATPLRDNVFLFKLNIGGLKSMSKKYVYQFSEGNASMRNLLGGKGRVISDWKQCVNGKSMTWAMRLQK